MFDLAPTRKLMILLSLMGGGIFRLAREGSKYALNILRCSLDGQQAASLDRLPVGISLQTLQLYTHGDAEVVCICVCVFSGSREGVSRIQTHT